MLYAGVDLGGTTFGVALAGADGKIVAAREAPTESHEGPDAVLDRIAGLVDELSREAGTKPGGLGMGVPGLVDLDTGATKWLPNLYTGWRDVPVAARLSKRLGYPVHVLNDVRTATLGEMAFGHGRTAKTFLFFTLGTGIGGGVVVDGKLRLGPVGEAGELGHQTIIPDGPRCGCGNRGCLEALASAPALAAEGIRLLRTGQAPKLHERVGGDAGRVTPRDMAEAAAAGDEAVRDAVVRVAGFLGIGVSNLVTSLHPELVLLGGGMAGMGPILFDAVRAEVRRRVTLIPLDTVRIEPAALGSRAGVLGGVALAARGGISAI